MLHPMARFWVALLGKFSWVLAGLGSKNVPPVPPQSVPVAVGLILTKHDWNGGSIPLTVIASAPLLIVPPRRRFASPWPDLLEGLLCRLVDEAVLVL